MKFLFLFIPFILFAQEEVKWINNVRLYSISKSAATLTWDAVANAEFYECRETWWDPTPEIIYNIGSTETTEFIIVRRRAGHFFYEVRACAYSQSGQKSCSEWASTLNVDLAMLHDNGLGKWLVYWKLPPPTDPVIE